MQNLSDFFNKIRQTISLKPFLSELEKTFREKKNMNKEQIEKYAQLISDYTQKNYKKCFREPSGQLKHKFIVPGSCYSDSLWDWDSWLTDLALGKFADSEDIEEYEKGCILNFLDFVEADGATPIFITPENTNMMYVDGKKSNIHKPNLAQHALFISENHNHDASWLKDRFGLFEQYLGYYETYCKHESGLYFWLDDCAIGVDNDPCTFYRPNKSSASIYLNCFMYQEFLALAKLADMLNLDEIKTKYQQSAANLKKAIQENCWDERDGFFYSVDINLLPVDKNEKLHAGCPRHWNCLIQRIEVWSGFLAMWAEIATKEQAERMVKEHYLNEKTFFAPYGVRTLSKMEKMYAIIKSGNPSCWLGPIWGISNYMVFDGLVKYGFHQQAADLAKKTILLFGQDIEKNGEMHEYYHPETGEGVNNPGFQNWNLLSLNMFDWLKEQDAF